MAPPDPTDGKPAERPASAARSAGMEHEIHLTETDTPSAASLLLGAAAVLPILIGTDITWWLDLPEAGIAAGLTVLWSGAVLVFLAGVWRGLSFRTPPDGARPRQVAASLWLFLLGLLALASPFPVPAVVLLILGFGSLAVLDPKGARTGEVPPFLGRLRPVQMLVALIGLTALLVRVLQAGGGAGG
jgi:hypothetical protein